MCADIYHSSNTGPFLIVTVQTPRSDMLLMLLIPPRYWLPALEFCFYLTTLMSSLLVCVCNVRLDFGWNNCNSCLYCFSPLIYRTLYNWSRLLDHRTWLAFFLILTIWLESLRAWCFLWLPPLHTWVISPWCLLTDILIAHPKGNGEVLWYTSYACCLVSWVARFVLNSWCRLICCFFESGVVS